MVASFHLPQNGASFCSQRPQEVISVWEESYNWFSSRSHLLFFAVLYVCVPFCVRLQESWIQMRSRGWFISVFVWCLSIIFICVWFLWLCWWSPVEWARLSVAAIECAVQKQIQYGWIKLCYIIKGAFTGVNSLRWLLLIVITDANVHRKLARETDR